MVQAAERAREIACLIPYVHRLSRTDCQDAANIGLQRMMHKSEIESLIELARTDQVFSRCIPLLHSPRHLPPPFLVAAPGLAPMWCFSGMIPHMHS